MMTPNAIIEFNYDVLMSDGSTIKVYSKITNGGFNARQYSLSHGITISETSLLKSLKRRLYLIDKNEYSDNIINWVNNHPEIKAVKDQAQPCNVLLAIQRIPVKEFLARNTD